MQRCPVLRQGKEWGYRISAQISGSLIVFQQRNGDFAEAVRRISRHLVSCNGTGEAERADILQYL